MVTSRGCVGNTGDDDVRAMGPCPKTGARSKPSRLSRPEPDSIVIKLELSANFDDACAGEASSCHERRGDGVSCVRRPEGRDRGENLEFMKCFEDLCLGVEISSTRVCGVLRGNESGRDPSVSDDITLFLLVRRRVDSCIRRI